MPTETFQRRAIDQFVCHGMILSPNKEWTSKAKLIKFPSAIFDILSHLLQGALPDDLIWLWCYGGPKINTLMVLKLMELWPNDHWLISAFIPKKYEKSIFPKIFIFLKNKFGNKLIGRRIPLYILLTFTTKTWTWLFESGFKLKLSTFLTFIGGISDFEIQLFNEFEIS